MRFIQIFIILCLMGHGLRANPILKEKTKNNLKILELYAQMEKAMRPVIGDDGWEKYRSAIEFAAIKHEGQFRKDKDKTPYLIHPMGVSFSLFYEGDVRDLDTLITALLHDTLEDTDTAYDEIKNRFGETIASAVKELTNDPNLNSEENKQRQVEHAPHLSPIAKAVKLSDRLYNIRDLNTQPPSWSPEKVQNYRNWGKKLGFALKGTNEKMEKALEDEITRQESRLKELFHAHYAGELGDKWTFTSDHLPIGVKIGSHLFGSWNLLAKPYLHYIEKNDQGLKNSLILKLNVPAKNGLTERENRILDDLSDYLNRFSAFALQEVTPDMFDAMISILPSHFALLPETKKELKTELAILYDKNLFRLLAYENHPFTVYPKRGFIFADLLAKGENKNYRFIGAHLPGGPQKRLARDELANALMRMDNPKIASILIGDMNASPETLDAQFKKSAAFWQRDFPFKRVETPYYTHINTALEAAFIDQIYLSGCVGSPLLSNAFSQEVEKIDQLLKS